MNQKQPPRFPQYLTPRHSPPLPPTHQRPLWTNSNFPPTNTPLRNDSWNAFTQPVPANQQQWQHYEAIPIGDNVYELQPSATPQSYNVQPSIPQPTPYFPPPPPSQPSPATLNYFQPSVGGIIGLGPPRPPYRSLPPLPPNFGRLNFGPPSRDTFRISPVPMPLTRPEPPARENPLAAHSRDASEGRVNCDKYFQTDRPRRKRGCSKAHQREKRGSQDDGPRDLTKSAHKNQSVQYQEDDLANACDELDNTNQQSKHVDEKEMKDAETFMGGSLEGNSGMPEKIHERATAIADYNNNPVPDIT